MSHEPVLKEGEHIYVKKATGQYSKLFKEGYVYKVEISDLGMAVKDETGDWDYILVNAYLNKQIVEIDDKHGYIKASKAGPKELAKAGVKMKMDKLAAEKPNPIKRKPGPKPKGV